MDAYLALRTLPFQALASVLGIDLTHFKRRSNGEYYGPCPIHKSQQNQTCFSFADTGVYHCFSCNAKGRGAIDLTIAVKDINFKAAVELLKEFSAQAPAPAANAALGAESDATEPLKPYTGSYEKFKVLCPWLEQRIPDQAVRERYGVFCYNNPARRSAYSRRVMIPVKDIQGNLYGYLGRAVETKAGNSPTSGLPAQKQDIPKYLFPKNLPKSQFLFGAWELSQGLYLPAVRQGEPHTGGLPVKVVYLVESPLCCLKFAMYGLPAVAAYGWSVSEDQVTILHSLCKGVVYLPDRNKSDAARAVLPLLAAHLWVRFPPLPEGCEDPEQLGREQILAL